MQVEMGLNSEAKFDSRVCFYLRNKREIIITLQKSCVPESNIKVRHERNVEDLCGLIRIS